MQSMQDDMQNMQNMQAMQYIRVRGHDPSLNLALEEAFFSRVAPGKSWFLLWQNGPSVIIGRHQNALEEVNAREIEDKGLPVVRRSTGGGAVYHDLGNLNFSFLEHHEGETGIDFGRYLSPIVRALKKLGVDARISGRNDLEVGGRKISGSAQRLNQGRVLHHGTLLVGADFEAMTRALNPEPEKFLSHGVASVRSRVANISEFWQEGCTLETLCGALASEVCGENAKSPARIPPDVLELAKTLAAEKYGNWDWNIGKSPKFTSRGSRRFPFGRVDLRLNVDRGRIVDCRIQGDFFSVADILELEALLVGCAFRAEDLRAALAGVNLKQWFAGCDDDMEVALREFLASV